MKPKYPWTEVFGEPHISTALEILLEAAEGLRKKSTLEHENKVTERLFLRINRSALYLDSNLFIDEQCRVYDFEDMDEPLRGIPDLIFRIPGLRKPFPYFAIDAKRLRFKQPNGKLQTGNSEYVSEYQGMRCFTEDRYAKGLNAGAMLGFVYDGNIAKSKEGISHLIGKHAELLKCHNPPKLIPSNLPQPDSGVEETVHALEERLFRIFHIFLSV